MDQGGGGVRQLPDEFGTVSHRRRTVQGLRWVGSARLLTQCVTWGLTAVTVRVLHPSDYGLVATSGLFTVLASMVLDGGLSPMLVSRHDLSPNVYGAVTVGVLLLSFAFCATIAFVAPAGAAFFKSPALVNVLRISSLQLPLSALSVCPLALLSKEMQFGRIAVTQAVSSITQGIATLAMAYRGEAYWALIYGTLLGCAIRSSGLWLVLSDRPSLNWRLRELRPLIGNSAHMIGQRLLYFVSSDFDTFILSRMIGAAELGPYSLARALSHAPLDQISGIVNQVTLPAFAAKSGEPEAQLGALKAMLALTAAVVFPLFWLMAAIAPTAFLLVFGPRWNALVFPFTAFTLMLPLRAVYTLIDTAVVGTGNTSTTFRNMIVWTVIMVPLLLLGAFFGARGEVVAWVMGFPLVFLSAMHQVARRFNAGLVDILRLLAAPAVCAALASAAVALIAVLLAHALTPIVLLLVETALAGGLYSLLMIRFGRGHYDQVTGLILQLIGRS
jgi:O-antigen/teichoic acid export membrane protein